MYKRFHGVDLHKSYSTIMVRDKDGSEIQYISRCKNFREYIESLNKDDVVVVEAMNNAFYWADQIEKQGAKCVIINPYRRTRLKSRERNV